MTKAKEVKPPDLEEFLERRDYSGAVTLLEFRRSGDPDNVETLEFLAYAYFHYGDHAKVGRAAPTTTTRGGPIVPQIPPSPPSTPPPPRLTPPPRLPQALKVYGDLLDLPDPDPVYHTYRAACLFYMGKYKEAEAEVDRGPRSKLQSRIHFHCSHRLNDESKLMNYHQQLSDSLEDQLSVAAIHYLRSHYQEATDIYKRLLLEHREYLALNVYVALCYSKLDYYDVSLEILAMYLQAHPDSAIAVNLKACNHFRLYNGKAAEAELKVVTDGSNGLDMDNFLIKHNLVVFRNGENALQVLPPLIGTPPEARLNLVIHYLRNGEIEEALNLVKDLEPQTPQEYILKGVVHASVGQQFNDQEQLKMAQQYFQLVGASASECDTIPGRQCMASCFFLLKQFEDVLIYLKSIKTYFYDDDDFNWNYGIAQAASGNFKEGEELLLLVQNERHLNDFCYLSWLARCYVMNGKSRLAWELYLRMDTSDESFSLLLLIANDCYKQGAFLYAAKAFDILERLDPAPEYWEGKRGACVGVFQQVIAGRESRDSLRDVLSMLRNTSNPQVEYIIRIMRKWQSSNKEGGFEDGPSM